MTKPVVISQSSGSELPYSFKSLTYRQFQRAITLHDSPTEGETREQKLARQEEAIKALVEVNDDFFEEALNKDVQRVFKAAIEFNMLSEDELKKSA